MKAFPPAPLGALAARAFALCGRRIRLYAAVSAAAFGLSAAVYFALHRAPYALLLGETIAGAIISTVTYVHVAVDEGESGWTAAQRWERILERVWAVILIELFVFFVGSLGLGLIASGDLWGALGGTATLLFSGTLILADVDASVAGDRSTLTILPFSCAHSIALSLTPANTGRVLLLLGLNVLISNVLALLVPAFHALHVADPNLWSVLLEFLITVPLAAFSAMVYLDCAVRERNDTV